MHHSFLHTEIRHLFLSASSFDMLMFHGRLSDIVLLSSLQNEIGRSPRIFKPTYTKPHRLPSEKLLLAAGALLTSSGFSPRPSNEKRK